MGETTGIEWTDATFNPWIGCQKVSEGCRFCYAERMNNVYGWVKEWNGRYYRVMSDAYWFKPLRWKNKCVFAGSLCDILDPNVPQEYRTRLMELIEATPSLTWMLLTKRIENHNLLWDTYPDNTAIGVTIEKQYLYNRLNILRRVRCRTKFISMEPLLERIDLPYNDIDLVIVGGESGPYARVLDSDWVRNVRDECELYGAPFNFKQWGEWIPEDQLKYLPEQDFDAFKTAIVGDMKYYRLGVKTTGHILDGQEHRERLGCGTT